MKTNVNKEYLSSLFRGMAGLFQKNLILRDLKKIMYYIDGIILLFIKKPKKRKTKKKKVLLIYNLAFGDGVIFRCSMVYLREIYPKGEYEITLLCQKGINKLYENDNIYDSIIPIDFNKSTVNIIERFKNFKLLRKYYYDIVIDPVGTSEWLTNIFYTRASVSKNKIGVRDITIDSYCSIKKIKKIYNEIIEIDIPRLSLIEYYATFFRKLSKGKISLEVGLEKLNTTPNQIDLPEKYYIIFPSASMKLKRWSLEKYNQLAEKIYKKTKLPLVLVGTKADEEVIDEFKKIINVPYINLVSKTSLNDYIDILKKSSLIITNDTSAYHIAVVEEVPVAIITGGYTYYRYVDYNFKRKNEFKKPCIIVHEMKCFDCGNRCRILNKDNINWPCLEKISVKDAWTKIEKLINDNNIGG